MDTFGCIHFLRTHMVGLILKADLDLHFLPPDNLFLLQDSHSHLINLIFQPAFDSLVLSAHSAQPFYL